MSKKKKDTTPVDITNWTPEALKEYFDIYLPKALLLPSVSDCYSYLNIKEDSAALDIPYGTSGKTIREIIVHTFTKVPVKVSEDDMKEELLAKASKALSLINDTTLANASAKELSQVVSQLIEKYRLLNDKSTQNVSINQLSLLIENLEKPIKDLNKPTL